MDAAGAGLDDAPMAWIRTIGRDEAAGELADLYERVAADGGAVENVFRGQSLAPAALASLVELHDRVMYASEGVSRAERELAAVVASRLNGSRYRLQHHLAALKGLWPDDRHLVADAVATGRVTRLGDREEQIVSFATKLTMNPRDMTEDDLGLLRAVGLDDRAILDLVQVVSLVNALDRLALGLGVSLGEGEGDPGGRARAHDAR